MSADAVGETGGDESVDSGELGSAESGDDILAVIRISDVFTPSLPLMCVACQHDKYANKIQI